MEFSNYKCPVCEKQFTNSDDIVVCPECGTPHHRECYEETGHCFYEDRHNDSFSFEDAENPSVDENESTEDDGTITCPECGAINEKYAFYCEKCSYPFDEADRKGAESENTSSQSSNQPYGNNGMPPFGVPFGMPQQGGFNFDPMAGFKSDEVISDNITAGEVSKYVGKNTPYFLRIFGNIKRKGKSKFNFSAFLFSGMYFLYRKMIIPGIILSAIIIAIQAGSILITYSSEYENLYKSVVSSLDSATSAILYNNPIQFVQYLFNTLSASDAFFLMLPNILDFIRFPVMLISGFIANRIYCNQSFRKIKKIKNTDDITDKSKKLEEKGGVNLSLAICVGATYLLLSYVPIFLQLFR